MSKENCISIRPFVTSEKECLNLCQKSRNCGYYKYIKGEILHGQLDIFYHLISLTEKKLSPEDTTDVIPTGRQIAISRLTGRGGGLFIPRPGMPALVTRMGQQTDPGVLMAFDMAYFYKILSLNQDSWN